MDDEDKEKAIYGRYGHVSDSGEGSLTMSVVIICIIAASAGLMFG